MRTLTLLALLASWLTPADACDLCGVYSASEATRDVGVATTPSTTGVSRFRGSIAEQFTHFGTTSVDGSAVPNAAGQSLDSSITQLLFSYAVSEAAALQLNLPIIYRSYRRPGDGAIESGSVSGPGDASVLGKYELVRAASGEKSVSWSALAGVKLPTGSAARLREELSETETPAGQSPSGIHGHDLTLGTGSVDGIVGTAAEAHLKRYLFQAFAQYAVRTTGRYDYRFANDLMWSAGPGYYLVLGDAGSLSVSANASGELKGRDTFQGVVAEDTGINAVYVGPKLGATFGSGVAATLAVELPVVRDNTAFQVVADSKLYATLLLKF
ncbi:MAG: hypothetical protein HY075_14085 [Deltaproteobacteria bacterium]|nr:hypothetical protein [Deltaproteobacteria bacterium]